MAEEKREHWSSSLTFLLAAIGSAVGIGNIWRFPYLFGQNGGASFLFVYLICVAIIGLPLMFLETAAGRRFSSSIAGTFKKLKAPRWAAWASIIIGFVILSYYVVITGWTLLFSAAYFTGNISDFSIVTAGYLGAASFIVVVALLFLVERRSLKAGLEKATVIMMPILIASLIFLVIFSLSQPGSFANMQKYLSDTFKMEAITDLNVWFFAATQVLFSLWAGYGIMITYGSYMEKKSRIVPLNAITVAADTSISLLAILLIVPLALSYGINPEQGFTLAFVTMPHIFLLIPFGFLFGGIFFLMLFAAAFTSAMAMFEVSLASVDETFKMERKKAAKILIILLAILAIPSALSYSPMALSVMGKPVLDALDLVVGSALSPISAVIVCIVLAWFWKNEDFISELGVKKSIWTKILIFMAKFVVPVLLMLFFAVGIAKNIFGM